MDAWETVPARPPRRRPGLRLDLRDRCPSGSAGLARRPPRSLRRRVQGGAASAYPPHGFGTVSAVPAGLRRGAAPATQSRLVSGMAAGRTLAFVVAHPDDDAYGIAGAVALHADEPDFRFVLVHATDGEAGDIREGFPATPRDAGRHAPTGGRVSLARPRPCAGPPRLARLPRRRGLRRPVRRPCLVHRAVLDEEQPTVVGTFGPDGILVTPTTSRSGQRPTPRSCSARRQFGPVSSGSCTAASLRVSSRGGRRSVRPWDVGSSTRH